MRRIGRRSIAAVVGVVAALGIAELAVRVVPVDLPPGIRGAVGLHDLREIVRHHERAYGESKYHPLRKLMLGIPEVFRFLFRLQGGHYDRPG